LIKQKIFLKLILFLFLSSAVFLFSGCSLTGKQDGGIYKSTDGGLTFGQKVYIDEENSIARADILDIEIDPDQQDVVYIGTERLGILRSVNGGESWVRDVNNFTSVRSIKKIPGSQKIYVAVKKGARGKVLKTEDGGENWAEVYTEKTEGSIVGVIAYDYNNPDILYIGTSKGGIFKTEDGGKTWRTLLWAESGVRTIEVDPNNTSIVYFGTVNSGAFISKNGGGDFSEIKRSGQILNIVVSPDKEGLVYLSNEEGLSVSNDYGENWESINTLVKPEEVFSRGLAVNPLATNEIFYSSGKAFYKSTNKGKSWQPVQFDIGRSLQEIEINMHNPDVIYLGTVAQKSSFSLFPGN
jgi:photosystem II stability/assembly factor-like uncharacterized protein